MWKLIKYYCNVNLLDMSIKHLLGELDKQGIIEINPKKKVWYLNLCVNQLEVMYQEIILIYLGLIIIDGIIKMEKW